MLAVDLEACSDLPFSFPSRPGLQCSYFADEISMFNKLLAMVREYDPDILVGYEVIEIKLHTEFLLRWKVHDFICCRYVKCRGAI